MIRLVYQATTYKHELVTGRYVRCHGSKGKYRFTVFETATCWAKGNYYGKAGMGYTLREIETDGTELPADLRELCIKSKTNEVWPLEQKA